MFIDKGIIPFAHWSDWGMLCFDASEDKPNNEYPIVLWDHETADQFEKKYENFEQMLEQLDIESKK